jgi:hypothetical protein
MPLVKGMPSSPAAVAGEIVAQRFEHHPLTGRDLTQQSQFVTVERPGIGMGQQARLGHYQLRHVVQVMHGRVVAVLGEPRTGDLVTILGPLAEGKQRLMAALLGALPGDLQHVVGREVRVLQASRGLSKCAVAAGVATQHGERDEHLRAERHPRVVGIVANTAGGGQKLVERAIE